MQTTHKRVSRELDALEQALRVFDLWDSQAPSAQALASTQPFCVDTLNFPQWLQFIFLPRMRMLCEQAMPLPAKCGVAPMCEEYFRALPRSGKTLIEPLQTIDLILDPSAA